MPNIVGLAILESMVTLAASQVELEPAGIGRSDANAPAQVSASEHDWVIIGPSMGGTELIVIECRACDETRSFSATPTTHTKPKVGVEGECQANHPAERG